MNRRREAPTTFVWPPSLQVTGELPPLQVFSLLLRNVKHLILLPKNILGVPTKLYMSKREKIEMLFCIILTE